MSEKENVEDLAMELKKDYTIVMVTHNMQLEVRNEQLIHMRELCEIVIGRVTAALQDGSVEQANSSRWREI